MVWLSCGRIYLRRFIKQQSYDRIAAMTASSTASTRARHGGRFRGRTIESITSSKSPLNPLFQFAKALRPRSLNKGINKTPRLPQREAELLHNLELWLQTNTFRDGYIVTGRTLASLHRVTWLCHKLGYERITAVTIRALAHRCAEIVDIFADGDMANISTTNGMTKSSTAIHVHQFTSNMGPLLLGLACLTEKGSPAHGVANSVFVSASTLCERHVDEFIAKDLMLISCAYSIVKVRAVRLFAAMSPCVIAKMDMLTDREFIEIVVSFSKIQVSASELLRAVLASKKSSDYLMYNLAKAFLFETSISLHESFPRIAESLERALESGSISPYHIAFVLRSFYDGDRFFHAPSYSKVLLFATERTDDFTFFELNVLLRSFARMDNTNKFIDEVVPSIKRRIRPAVMGRGAPGVTTHELCTLVKTFAELYPDKGALNLLRTITNSVSLFGFNAFSLKSLSFLLRSYIHGNFVDLDLCLSACSYVSRSLNDTRNCSSDFYFFVKNASLLTQLHCPTAKDTSLGDKIINALCDDRNVQCLIEFSRTDLLVSTVYALANLRPNIPSPLLSELANLCSKAVSNSPPGSLCSLYDSLSLFTEARNNDAVVLFFTTAPPPPPASAKFFAAAYSRIGIELSDFIDDSENPLKRPFDENDIASVFDGNTPDWLTESTSKLVQNCDNNSCSKKSSDMRVHQVLQFEEPEPTNWNHRPVNPKIWSAALSKGPST